MRTTCNSPSPSNIIQSTAGSGTVLSNNCKTGLYTAKIIITHPNKIDRLSHLLLNGLYCHKFFLKFLQENP